jgi:hypothetical protein
VASSPAGIGEAVPRDGTQGAGPASAASPCREPAANVDKASHARLNRKGTLWTSAWGLNGRRSGPGAYR